MFFFSKRKAFGENKNSGCAHPSFLFFLFSLFPFGLMYVVIVDINEKMQKLEGRVDDLFSSSTILFLAKTLLVTFLSDIGE